jgi:DNA uptake protein ComE-like DNA-binding protein
MRFLVGLGLGFGVGLLMAPQPGSRTRRQLARKAENIGDALREQPLRERVRETASEIGRTAAEYAQAAAQKLGAGPLLMLNTGSLDQLMEIYGIGPVLAERIIEGRPYTSPHQVVERGILPERTFAELKRELKSA